MTVLLRWTIRIHKWLALAVGIQIVLWVMGGVVMSVIPIERVRGEHNIAPTVDQPLRLDGLIPPDAAVLASGPGDDIRSVTLGTRLDRPVYDVVRLDGARDLVDARSGERLTPIDRDMARVVARRDYAGDADIASVEYFETPTGEYRRAGPAWRISFADGEGTRLYVDPQTGLVSARRNDAWRVYDFFWMLHIMDYKSRENFNNPLLITAAGLALVTVLAGLVLLVLRLQRLARMELARRRAAT
ncbi:MAG: PepSY domain-containing protein [Pseudomonadota bacterium]|nr:PepSY domain-containing protein [Pseudomonadota bacterium]